MWFEPSEDNNMEGPVDFPFGGALQWLWHILTDHQYNVPAGDKFLQDTVPTIVTSSVWNDPTQKSAIFITWDEDQDNNSWGLANEGNNVPMIVIPSPNSGMRQGHFVALGYHNHYSLLRTIEDALQLPRLTNNDLSALPMNDYWP